VLHASSAWEGERREVAAVTPEEKTQRRLWMDFAADPKVAEANVEAIVKKAG